MTTNQNRVAAGVPTGGQFAVSVHAESDVNLATPDDFYTGPSSNKGLDRFWKISRTVSGYDDKLGCASAVNEAIDAVPYDEKALVAYLLLTETTDDEHRPYYYADLYDADGNSMGHTVPVPGDTFHGERVPEAFRPDDETALPGQDLPRHGSTYARGHIIDVAKVRGFDWDAEQVRVQEEVAFAAIDPNWEHFVISPSVIRDQIDEELDGDEELTDAERDEVVRRYDGIEPDYEKVYSAFHSEVRRSVESVLNERGR